MERQTIFKCASIRSSRMQAVHPNIPAGRAVSRRIQGRLSRLKVQASSAEALSSTAAGYKTRSGVRQMEPQTETGGHGGGGKGSTKPPPAGDGGTGANDWDDFLERINVPKRIQAGVRGRMEADADFLFKLAVECGLDLAIILTVNAVARRSRFVSEFEFVLSQCAVSLLADFALVYLLAPIARRPVPPSALKARLARLPSHVFQRPFRRYTLVQRVACFGTKMVQYGTVGFIMGCVGSAAVAGLTSLREQLDPDFVPPPTVQPVLGTGLGWLYFLGIHSNVRYNFVNAIEDVLYTRYPGPVSKLGSVGLRLANNFVGAASWMRTAQAMGLNQPRERHTAASKPAK
eukprot:jgi/Botrbrau1/9521/Bobra.0211s0012.1